MRAARRLRPRSIPADVEPVRLVTLVQQRTRLPEQLEGRIDLVRRKLEDGRPVSLRDDHAATAKELPFQVLGVEEHAQFASRSRTASARRASRSQNVQPAKLTYLFTLWRR